MGDMLIDWVDLDGVESGCYCGVQHVCLFMLAILLVALRCPV